eukprot:366166-Chlamydomonas_euryale.AAC.20
MFMYVHCDAPRAPPGRADGAPSPLEPQRLQHRDAQRRLPGAAALRALLPCAHRRRARPPAGPGRVCRLRAAADRCAHGGAAGGGPSWASSLPPCFAFFTLAPHSPFPQPLLVRPASTTGTAPLASSLP